jgi:hypothetical protein
MMHQKALLFNDQEIAQQVMNLNYLPTNNKPDQRWDKQMREVKELGRKVIAICYSFT